LRPALRRRVSLPKSGAVSHRKVVSVSNARAAWKFWRSPCARNWRGSNPRPKHFVARRNSVLFPGSGVPGVPEGVYTQLGYSRPRTSHESVSRVCPCFPCLHNAASVAVPRSERKRLGAQGKCTSKARRGLVERLESLVVEIQTWVEDGVSRPRGAKDAGLRESHWGRGWLGGIGPRSWAGMKPYVGGLPGMNCHCSRFSGVAASMPTSMQGVRDWSAVSEKSTSIASWCQNVGAQRTSCPPCAPGFFQEVLIGVEN